MRKRIFPYETWYYFGWALGITFFLSLSIFLVLGFSTSNPLRFLIAFFAPAIVAALLNMIKEAEYDDGYCLLYRIKIIRAPFALTQRLLSSVPLVVVRIISVIIAVWLLQWLFLGTTFSYDFKNYQLKNGDNVCLPLAGSYAKYDNRANVIKARRSFFGEEILIDLRNDNPKAIGISLLGDRIAVRFHANSDWQYGRGEGCSYIDCYSLKTGKFVGGNTFGEGGYWHSPLYLIW